MDDKKTIDMVYVNKYGSLNLEPIDQLPDNNCSNCSVIATKPQQEICKGCYRAGVFRYWFSNDNYTMDVRK